MMNVMASRAANSPLRRALIPAAFAAAVSGVLPFIGLVRAADVQVLDRLSALLPMRAAVFTAAVLIDEDSLRRFGAWPWPRQRLAEVIDEIQAHHPSGIVVDLLLPDPREGDARLSAALAGSPSFLAAALDDEGRWLRPAPELRARAAEGHVSFELGEDGVLRGFLSTKQGEGRSLPALAMAAAGIAAPSLPIPVARWVRPGFRVAPSAIPSIGAAELLGGRTDEPEFRGRVVFIGANAAGIGDRAVVPGSGGGSPIAGVLVHAAAAEAVRAGDLRKALPWPIAALTAGLLALFGGALRGANRRRGEIVALAVVLSPWPLAYLGLAIFDVEVPAVSTAVSLVAVGAGTVLLEVGALRRRASAQAGRVARLESMARSFEAIQREEAEARRVVAHELKTPITSVRGLAQLLEGFDLTEPERKRVAGLMVSETSRLSEMVEGLLDLERLKLKDFRRAARRVDLSHLVADRIAVFNTGGAHEIRAEVDSGIDVLGDAALLARVVENLVTNAVKFSPVGSPVAIRLHTEAHEVALEIEDRGPGVDPLDRERIFQRFARAPSAAATPGLGLGLALVSEVVAWHGGRIEVADGAHGGSLFRVGLPHLAP